jgi:hypothetical protein
MQRRSADYWKARIDEQRKQGTSAAEYCRKRSLDRGTFQRWRRRLDGGTVNQGLVEIARTELAREPGEPAALSIQLTDGTLVRFHRLPDADSAGRLVAAIRVASQE